MNKFIRIIGWLVFFFGCLGFDGTLFAQKPLLEYSTADSWPTVFSQKISNDGKYLAYFKKNDRAGNTFTVQSTVSQWKMEIASVADNFQITEDSQRIIFAFRNDSIGIIELGKSAVEYIGKVDKFEAPINGTGRWLVCQLKDPQHNLLVFDFQQGTQKRYQYIREFQFSPAGAILLMQTIGMGDQLDKIYYLDLAEGRMKCIGSGYTATRVVFDRTEQKLAYISNIKSNSLNKQDLRYYHCGMDSAKVLVDNTTPGMKKMVVNGSLPVKFSQGGDKIFFGIKGQDNPIGNGTLPSVPHTVMIRHYQDDFFEFKKTTGPYLAMIQLNEEHSVIKLQQSHDNSFHFGGDFDDDYIAVESNAFGAKEESAWRMSALPDIYLISTKDGSRKLIRKRLECYEDLAFSPGGKYLTWYDRASKNWFTYNVLSDITTNITQSIHVPIYIKDDQPRFPAPEGIAGWMEKDKLILIYDRFDIWQVDPEGKKPPVNLTHGYGVKNNTRLRIMNFSQHENQRFFKGDTLFLAALNLSTKYNGFFKLSLTANRYLQKLTMQPKAFYLPLPQNTTWALSGQEIPTLPLKAKNANTFLLNCMSTTEYPNLNITSDFSKFKPITNFSPQKAYNWYTSELVNWKLFDGKKAEGVLYKPENFDPQKKYPVIFYYYSRSADALNLFLRPELSRGNLNIPWFVSNGYVVFVPDIYYKIGYFGESAYNSITSAALMLSRKPWVNAHKMGLQGHSNGGFETNYVVTRTHLFAAAAPAAGYGDLISSYGHDDKKSFYESGFGRVGATLWQKPNLYIRNSPVFKADRVTTPLFIMHNINDGNVPWTQGVEWYRDLVRLRKKVWMVSYAGETHTIEDPVNKLDYSIRLGQFFDYYLKDALPPKWMTEGGNSLELDHSGKKP